MSQSTRGRESSDFQPCKWDKMCCLSPSFGISHKFKLWKFNVVFQRFVSLMANTFLLGVQ